MKFLKFFTVITFVFVALTIFTGKILAHEDEHTEEVVTTSTTTTETSLTSATESGKTVNSFEIFWPLVAGKTRADNLYFLKIWKENARGWLIFGAPQKADYQTLRATKRVLEVESLVNAGKYDLAKETEASANNFLTKATDTLKNTKEIPTDVQSSVKNRLDNLIKLVDQLNSKTADQKDLNQQIVLTHTLIENLLKIVTPAN